ncbi:hypothetical protein A6A12_2482 [Vibrio anguillarum]|nr:hypothetical protein A6A12_2482 [Vibrio anguillarum]
MFERALSSSVVAFTRPQQTGYIVHVMEIYRPIPKSLVVNSAYNE